MKKIFLLFMIVLLAGSIFAITGSAVNQNKEGNSEKVQATTTAQQENQGEATQIQSQKKVLTQAQIQKAIQIKNKLQINKQKGECPEKCSCDGSAVKCEFANGTGQMTITAGSSGNTIVQVKDVKMSTKVTLYKADDGNVYGVFKDNSTKIIEIMPDEIKEIVKEKIKTKLENHEIKLDENGEYQVQAQKRARLFGLFPVKERVRIHMNSETGEIIRTRTSWWAFLAKDVDDDETEEIPENEEPASVDEINESSE